MADNGKMRIVAEFDSSKAEASAKRTNQELGKIGATAKAAGDQTQAGLDKISEAALRSQKVVAALGEDLVGAATAARVSAGGLNQIAQEAQRGADQIDRLRTSAAQYAREQQQNKHSGDGPKRPDADKLAEQYRQAQLQAEEQARRKVDSLIAGSQAKEMSGLQRIEAQRKKALADLGLTEDLQKKINGHFDQMRDKAGNQELASKIKQFIQNPLQTVGDLAEQSVLKLGGLGVAAVGGVLALGAAFKFLKSEADGFAQEALQIEQLSARTGLTTEQTQLFGKAAEYAGVNANVLGMAVKQLNESMAEGNGESAKASAALSVLGVQITHTADGAVDAGAAVDQAFRALQKIPDYYQRATLAQEIFGRGAKEFLPLIDSYDKLSQRAKEHARILSGEELQAIDAYRKKVLDLENEFERLTSKLKEKAVWALDLVVSGPLWLKNMLDAHTGGQSGNILQAVLSGATGGLLGRPSAPTDIVGNSLQDRLHQEAGRLGANGFGTITADRNAALEDQLPQLRLDRLKKDLQVAEDTAKLKIGDATAPASAVRAANQAVERLKDQIASAEQAIAAPKEAAAALRTARNAADEAEGRDATGIRALELQNAREIQNSETHINSRGNVSRVTNKQAEAEYRRQLAAEIQTEQRKEHEQTLALEVKANEESLTLRVNGLKRAEQAENDSLKLREALGLENVRDLEDQKLKIYRDTLDKETALEKEKNDISRTQLLTEAARKVGPNGLSSDPKERARQLEEFRQQAQAINASYDEKDRNLDQQTAAAKKSAGDQLAAQRAATDRQFQDQTKDYQFQTAQQVSEFQAEQLRASRDKQLGQLEEVKAQTVQQKIAVEQQKLAIEVDYLQRAAEASKTIRDAEYKHEIEAIEDQVQKGQASRADADVREAALRARQKDQDTQQAQQTADAVAEIQLKSGRATTSIIVDQQRSIYEGVKKDLDQLFDDTLSKGKSVWQALGDSIRNSLLGAFRDVVTSQLAAAITGSITGRSVQVQPGGSRGGIFGTLFGGSQQPVISIGSGGSAASIATPPFVPSSRDYSDSSDSSATGGGGGVSTGGGWNDWRSWGGGDSSPSSSYGAPSSSEAAAPEAAAAAPRGIPGIGGQGGGPLGGLLGMFGKGGGFKASLGKFDQTFLNGAFHPGNTASFGANLSQLGHSQAALLGGSTLLMDGLHRGGAVGLGEDTAGGALVGFKYGGPIGAAIGAGAGALLGALRMTVWQTLPEQVKKRVKEQYHVDINTDTATQIANIAKQQYGGSIARALHDPSVLQMLGLYAETTGQKFGLVGPQAANFAYSGGQLTQAGTYHNGSLLGFQSSLSSLSNFAGTINSPTYGKYGENPSTISLALDGASSAAFLKGQTVDAIQSNPRTVADATLDASSGSYGRLEQYAAMTSPTTVLS
jgi:hypothetical protein